MNLDFILHMLVGGTIAIVLFSQRVHALIILIIIALLAGFKEFFDHFWVLGHCYPECMPEHWEDFLASFLMFFIVMPFVAVLQDKVESKYQKMARAGVCILALMVQLFYVHESEPYFSAGLNNLEKCKHADIKTPIREQRIHITDIKSGHISHQI